MAGFKTRARTVDMLGRQQIAGIPTAISELFKNAYDAYADNVIIDYLRSDNLMVIRDDGFGMTKEDFENKWLTIGTESKVSNHNSNGYTMGKTIRPLMGEKGIGRLAISLLGDQVLVITRAKRDNHIYNYIVSFINWKLFEIPGLNLDDIYVPIKEFNKFPSHQEIQELILEAITHIDSLKDKIDARSLEVVYSNIEKFQILNLEKKELQLKEPCKFNDEASGTRFYIFPTNHLVSKDLEPSKDDKDVPHLIKMLIGFTDILPEGQEVPIKAQFRDHKFIEFSNEIISESEFLTREEFFKGDQIFQGAFDKYGNFSGKAIIYGTEQEQKYIIPWDNGNNLTACGPFEIIVMAVQGKQSESLLDKEKHSILTDKLYKYGGMYIYKDGIRVLPYGNNKYDFLDIELRRSKHAGEGFWSYRRTIGAIRLTQEDNDNLKEKAGREGFQENIAYRELRDIAMNFFIQTAKDFFQISGDFSDYYFKVKAENTRLTELLKKEEESKKKKKEFFIIRLNELSKLINNGIPQSECHNVIDELNLGLSYLENIVNLEEIASVIYSAEKVAIDKISKLKEKYLLIKPRGVSFSKVVNLEYESYKDDLNNINTLFINTLQKVECTIKGASDKAQIEFDRRKRLQESLVAISMSAKKQITEKVKSTDSTLDNVQNKVKNTTRLIVKTMEQTIRHAELKFTSTDFSNMPDEEIANWRINIEQEILSAMEQEQKELETISTLLDNVAWEKDEKGNIISSIDLQEANDLKMLELSEQAEIDSDLAQLGMAIHVINHEFDASIRMVRDNLRRLKAWADVNQGLQKVYTGIKHSFDHLDSYLTLFTPLNRRIQRQSSEIHGHEIEEFIKKLFSERFNRHNIGLTCSKQFRRFTINTYPSSIYPVFVNIVDNATYWIKGKANNGIIDIDIDDFGIIISNNGSNIPESEWEIIFETGFSHKPGGRGLGLSISNNVLKEQKMYLEVIKPKEGFNVTFRINFSGKGV